MPERDLSRDAKDLVRAGETLVFLTMVFARLRTTHPTVEERVRTAKEQFEERGVQEKTVRGYVRLLRTYELHGKAVDLERAYDRLVLAIKS